MMPHQLHNRSVSYAGLLAVCVALMALGGCKRTEEKPAPQAAPQAADAFRVTRVDLGNAIGADKKVTAPATAFKPNDTIYASVITEGAAPSVALSARWTFEDGQLVNEATQNIAPTGPAVTEFHISKPDGWPAGKYNLALSANGKPAGAAQFTVTN
jgi:hypothetical protein